MKSILIVGVLTAASLAQNMVIVIPPQGGVIPPPDMAASDAAGSAQRAYQQGVETQRIRQQTKLLEQQTEAIKRQNALLKQQQESALAAATVKTFIASSELRKPRIDDIDAATGKPRFETLSDYLDARDEWLIAETLRRWEVLHPLAPQPAH